MKIKSAVIMGIAAVITAGLIGCSSNDDNGGGAAGGGSTAKIMIGTMTKGSVIVNGVRFDDTAATLITDDQQTVLADGMTVKVKGTVNDDGVTGVAETVQVENEVRGPVTSVTGDTFVVHGQTVFVDGATILSGVTSSLPGVGEVVEVHGDRDAAGMIMATRVEKLGAGEQDEVRGMVANKTDTTFDIGNLTITVDLSTKVVPTSATFAALKNGDFVEVHLNNNIATRIVVEHLDHPEFEPAEGQEFEFEGFVSGFTGLSADFNVGSQTVRLDSSRIRFEGGLNSDLADGMKVEAEGHILAGDVLLADKIKFKESLRIEANADASGSAGVLGMTVKTTSLTRLSSNLSSIATITGGDGLRIRGFMNTDGSITATRVDKLSNTVDPGKVVLQGPVTNITASTFRIMGITISTSPSTSCSSDDDKGTDNNQTISQADFFASLVDGRTVVKAKGTFSSGTLAAKEIEFE